MACNQTNFLDPLLIEMDIALKILSGAAESNRPSPTNNDKQKISEAMSYDEKCHSIGLMRINHVGEICAQALYRGQALVCRESEAKALLQESATEELDHLTWCYQRIEELGGKQSALNPLWYFTSFGIGILAGVAGTPYNLGFVVETEKQVEIHLEKHLKILPENDRRSRTILKKMKEDEIKHRENAKVAGGVALPKFIRKSMSLVSKIMTSISYRF